MPAIRKNYDVAVSMYESGLSIGETAYLHGITRQAMHKILKRRNVIFRDNIKFGAENHFFNGGFEYDIRVRSITQSAISSGRLIKSPCEYCGNETVDAHHDDYNKPLSVRWLCRKCHALWHENNRPIRREIEMPPMKHKDIASLGGKASAKARKIRNEK